MKTILASRSIQFIFALLFLGILFKGTQTTLPTLQALPIYGINNTAAHQININDDLKNLYPLKAHHNKNTAPTPTTEIISVDNAFIPTAVVPEAPQNKTPDYFTLLKNNNILTLQAVTDNGAFINNHYYSFNADLTEFAYPSANGKTITPILNWLSPDTVTINEHPGKRHFNLTLTK